MTRSNKHNFSDKDLEGKSNEGKCRFEKRGFGTMVTTYLHFITKFLGGRNIEVYSKHCQAYEIEDFVKILNGFKLITVFAKCSTLDILNTPMEVYWFKQIFESK